MASEHGVNYWLRLAARGRYRLGAIVQLSGMSLRQLERCFQENLGRSPEEWLVEQRMVAARYMLIAGRNVKEIAFSLGYLHLSHFFRHFKNAYEMTPSQFLSKTGNLHNVALGY